jgi:ribonuclease D
MTQLDLGARATLLVDTPDALAELVSSLRGVDRIALDTEANGMHAFRERLCTVQLAWTPRGAEGSAAIAARESHLTPPIVTAVVDALLLDLSPLAPLLGGSGPLKILHDLTFDARILADRGLALGNVADTAIHARFLGRARTGLATLVEEIAGVVLDKRLQQHDWSLRPLGARELGYLDGDVRHLFALHDALGDQALRLGIEAELAFECEHRLRMATTPDPRAAWERIRGAEGLDEPSRRVLRRVVEERDRIAEQLDRPAGRVLSNDGGLALARRRGLDPRALAASRAEVHASRLRVAIERGLADPAEPEPPLPPPLDRAAIALRRRARSILLAWRKREAEARGVDEQVVLPGHAVDDLAQIVASEERSSGPIRAAIEAVSGLGSVRIARYADAWAELARRLGPGDDDAQSLSDDA